MGLWQTSVEFHFLVLSTSIDKFHRQQQLERARRDAARGNAFGRARPFVNKNIGFGPPKNVLIITLGGAGKQHKKVGNWSNH